MEVIRATSVSQSVNTSVCRCRGDIHARVSMQKYSLCVKYWRQIILSIDFCYFPGLRHRVSDLTLQPPYRDDTAAITTHSNTHINMRRGMEAHQRSKQQGRSNVLQVQANPGTVICRFQPAALLSERLMDFKRAKNDDHPHKWACQIQDRVLELHLAEPRPLPHHQSAGGNMNICCCVNRTAVSSCIVEKGKRESAVTWPCAQTLREVSGLNVWSDDACPPLVIPCWR